MFVPYIGLSNSGINKYPNRSLSEKNIGFGGLTKIFKNKIFIDGQKDIEQVLKQHPNTRAFVGELPNYIFKKLPVENRPAAIREILDVFDKVSNLIRDFEPNEFSKIDEIRNKRPLLVNELLTGVMQKYNVISNWDDIDVKYIDAGGKGRVYKINGLRDFVNEDEYVIKIFHQIKSPDWQPYKSHGCYAEINNGIYWKNHEGHDTHRGKYFFGSMDSGYIVSKYLDEDVRLPKRVVPEYKYGIKCTDEAKSGPLVGYNRLKGYNYDYGGMRVVNRLKNSNKEARKWLEQIKEVPLKDRPAWWYQQFNNRKNSDNKYAGLALGIKHLENKNEYIDKCIALNKPVVNQALAYVLKYLKHKDALEYFEKLVQTTDEITQIILFNEIPLLSKRKSKNIPIKDDITSTLEEIIPDRVYKFYKISEKYAKPSTIEHLASFIHLLPHENIPAQHLKLANIDNYELHDRMIWKFLNIPNEYKDILALNLSYKVKDPHLKQKLLNACRTSVSPDILPQIEYNIEHIK